ncbi:hypothetical protein ACFFMN_29460 [Planobispora siamensis]|uniref:hypothetical protein n=1 Tax=Planobispora siamensis TaxID=936338 RepID=UPI001952435A|nr:hypothetical protein [Planobispora siamensis]
MSTIFTLALAHFTFRFARKPEIEATFRRELDAALRLRAEDRADQVQRQIAVCAGPLFVAAEELSARLDNILNNQGFPALARDWETRRDQNWSNTHEYFLTSTLYLFGQYFARVQIMKDRLGVDEYLLQRDKDDLWSRVRGVTGALADYPTSYSPGCAGQDRQVMKWEQVAIGEALISHEGGVSTVLGYSAFMERLGEIDLHFQSLRALVIDLAPVPSGNCRWQRMLSLREELAKVTAECRRLLQRDVRFDDRGSGDAPAQRRSKLSR